MLEWIAAEKDALSVVTSRLQKDVRLSVSFKQGF